MELFYGRDIIYSGKTSAKYLEINNYGYYKNVDTDIKVHREKGRPDYQLIYVKNGDVNFLTDSGTEKAPAGTIILFRPNQVQIYSYSPAENSEYMWIHFSGTGAEKLLEGLFDEKQVLLSEGAFAFSDAFENIKNFCIKYDDISAQYASGIFIKMTAELKRHISRSDKEIEKVIGIMHTANINSYSNKDFAKMCNMSEYHFIRRFKKFTGMSPLKYKTRLVVERGAELLKSTDMNVSEIAFALGFEDSLYFSRVFKKATGVSPVAYRLSKNSVCHA